MEYIILSVRVDQETSFTVFNNPCSKVRGILTYIKKNYYYKVKWKTN